MAENLLTQQPVGGLAPPPAAAPAPQPQEPDYPLIKRVVVGDQPPPEFGSSAFGGAVKQNLRFAPKTAPASSWMKWFDQLGDEHKAERASSGIDLHLLLDPSKQLNRSQISDIIRSRAIEGPDEPAYTPDELRAASAGTGGLRDPGGVRGSAGLLAHAYRSQPATDLAGSPTSVKLTGIDVPVHGFKLAQDTARSYMEQAGLNYEPPTDYQPVDPERAKRIAQAYQDMPHAPDDPRVRRAYEALASETKAQYQAMLNSGMKVEFYPPDHDPYPLGPRQAVMDAVLNKHLYVFPTRSGFGSDPRFDHSKNPLNQDSGFEISGEPAKVNDLFRAVHDYFGHIKDGNGFRHDGEENAWRSHSAMYSPEARRAMTSETRGQNSWLNFGPHGEANRTAKTADTVFADQKAGIMPDWTVDEASGQRPLAGGHTEVLHNFGRMGGSSSAVTGSSGTYPLYAEAYRRAAAERGVQPRQMQSVTWEAVRGLFTPEFKRNKAKSQEIHDQWNRYASGKQSLDETRTNVKRLAGGIRVPDFISGVGSDEDSGDSPDS